jgi:hypothetical protein
MHHPRILGLAAVTLSFLTGHPGAAEPSFYKVPGLFSTQPDVTKSVNPIERFGPVGMGIDLIQPAFTMQVKNIEEGSPAAASGKLKKGQILESINGQTLADIDPRIQLGQILAAAEAKDGVIRFQLRDEPEEVIVRIPVLGAYSKTWPLNCPKSDRIVRAFADYLSQPGSNKGFADSGMLFLLSTGEEKDLEMVRTWARALKSAPTYAWHLGYGGIPLTEYYLRTGDDVVLPTIQSWVDSAVKGQYLDGWAGRGGVAAVTYGGGGGHLNAGGTAVVTFLLLAKECGANVPDHALLGALTHFYRFAGRGNNPYGDNEPEHGFVDNGKNGNLAFAMAAAASLTPEGEKSVYAGARDACAMTSFYTTTFMLHGHTGGGIGEIWRSAAMGLLYEKTPEQYREFMNHRQWHYDLSRRWDGSFGILGGARYDNTEWGAGYALSYTIPRKTLRLTGAPPSKFSKKYQLPERPWGTAEDDAFTSLETIGYAHTTLKPAHGEVRPDFSNETLTGDSGLHLLARLIRADIGDAELRRYAHHPDNEIRRIAVRKAMGINSHYLGKGASGGEARPDLIHEFLQSQDARLRHAAVDAIGASLSGDAIVAFLKPDGLELLFGTLRDPQESWLIKVAALGVIARLQADRVAEHLDLILPYLEHEEWWLQHAALNALTPVVADERCYQRVLPAVGQLLKTCQRYNTTASPMSGIRAQLRASKNPAVQKLAAQELMESFTGFAGTKTAPGGQDITTTYDSQMKFLAESLADVPGGYDVLYEIAKQRFPHNPLPYAPIFLSADPEKFGPELKKVIAPIIRDQLVYEYIGKNRRPLASEIDATRQNSFPEGSLDDLTSLYRKVGVHDYDWHPFGPDLRDAEWDYFTFDPPDKQAYDVSPWRYREVTYPPGMENWFQPDFQPAKAGWKNGQTPIGQYEGKLVTDSTRCGNPDCRHSDPMRSLWEKEVLLVRGIFPFPPLKPDHLYRLRVGTGQHVGSGDGYKIYLNGKALLETKEGVGRRQGAKPRGAYVTKEFLGEFEKGPVTIAATTFLRFGNKAIAQSPPVPQGIFSLWIEEMKLPPVNDESLRKSATVIPMLSMAWQEKQDPDNAELQSGDDLFHYDGKFVRNPKVLGSWTSIDQVTALEEFTPDRRMNPGRPSFSELTFEEQGRTANPLFIWSGATLMDLDRYQALTMTLKTIGGDDYLFVEAGGFSEKNSVGWKTPLVVMKRK